MNRHDHLRALGFVEEALGSRKVARLLLCEMGSVRRILQVAGDDLARRYRVPGHRALAWEAMRQLRLQAALEGSSSRLPILSPEDVGAILRPLLEGLRHERFYVLPVDAKLKPIRPPVVIAEGSPDFVTIAPRRVFEVLLREDAAAGFLAHNHPSGDPSPSTEDIRVTGELVRLGRALGTPILDHVVATEDGATASALPGQAGASASDRRDGQRRVVLSTGYGDNERTGRSPRGDGGR